MISIIWRKFTDKTGVNAEFYRAAAELRDLYEFRILDEYQDDLHAWLSEQLANADREEEEFISFTIVQAFQYHY